MRNTTISLRKKLALSALIAGSFLGMAGEANAAPITWANVAADWATGPNWVGGVAPADSLLTDTAVFNSAVTIQPTLAAVRSIAGITVDALSTNPITITTPTTGIGLSIGASGIDMNAAGANLTLGGAANNIFTIGAAQNWNVQAGRTLTAAGIVTLTNRLSLTGAGTVTLGGANTGAGGVSLAAGTVNINTVSALGTGQFIITGGTLSNASAINHNAVTQAWNGNFTHNAATTLNMGTGAVTMNAARTITVSGAGGLTIGGAITGATFGITKAGAGTLALNGVIGTTTGGLTVNAGQLTVGSAANTFTGNIVIAGASSVLQMTSGSNGNATSAPLGIGTGGNYKTATLTTGATFRPMANFNNNTATTALPGAGLIFTIGTGGGIFDTPTGVNFTIDDGATGGGSTAAGGTAAQQLRGTGALTKSGLGTLTLRQQFNFGGTINATAGSITLTGLGGFGLTSAATSIQSGAQLNVNGVNSTDAEPLTIFGAGLTATPQGALTNTGAAATWSGPITLGSAATIGTVTNALTLAGGASIATAGNTLTLRTFGAGQLNATGVISGAGPVVISSASTGVIALQGQHTYTGGTSLNSGLAVPTVSSVGPAGTPTSGPFGAGATPLILNGGQIRSTTGGANTIGNTVTIAADTTFPTAASEKNLTLTGPVTLTGNRILTGNVGATVAGTSVTFSGAIGGVGFGLTKAGTGTIVLGGANTYDGGTTVSAGTLAVTGSLANASALTVAGGANLQFLSNSVNTPATFSTLNLGGGAGTSTLSLELGVNTAGSDSLASTGAATTANNVAFNIYALPGFGTAATYDLATASGGLGGAAYSLASAPGGFTYILSSSPTLVQLSVTSSAYTGSLYWRGAVSNSWGALSGINTNFTQDSMGLVNAGISPDADNSVIFSADNAVGPAIATTLDNNFSVKDLTFVASPVGVTSVSIATGLNPANTLTITPAAPANGIDVVANAGNVTISAPVVLGAIQNWDVDGTGANGSSLTVSGGVSGISANTLDISSVGTGIVTLSGVSTYAGQTNVTSGILQGGATNSFSPNSLVNVTGTGILRLNGLSNTVLNLTGNGTLQNNHAATAATLTFGDANPSAFSGTIQNGGVGTLGITKVGAGAATLSGNNTYTGTTTINVGSLIAGSATALNSAGALTMAASTTLDLNGFGASFTTPTLDATSVITTSVAGPVTLSLSNAGAAIPALIQNGSGTTSLVIANANGGFLLSNAANTFSGGIILAHNATGTRMAPGTIVAGAYGTGAITIGQANTDKAGIYFATAGQTLSNPIVFNTALGTDRVGIRTDVAGIVLSGVITANLAPATFTANTATLGAFTLTNQVTGASGLVLDITSLTASATAFNVTLNNAAMTNNYQGNTVININPAVGKSATLNLGAANQLPNGAGTGNVIVNRNGTGIGLLNLAGFSDTINGLSGGGNVDGTSGTPTLTLGDNNATGNDFSGILQDTAGTLSLTKIGSGTQTLSGPNTFDGPVGVDGGLLAFSTVANLGNAAAATNVVNLNGGGISYLPAGPLSLGATRVVTIGAGGGTLNAADTLGVLTIDAGINPASTGNLTKTGVGKVVVPTAVTLNAGAGTVTVSGGTLQASFGTGGVGVINVGATGNLQLTNGATEILTLDGIASALSLTGGARLGFDLGAPTFSDRLTVDAGGTAVTGGIITLDFTNIGGLAAGTYDLLTAPSGLSGATYALGTAPNGFNYSIATIGDMLVQLTTTAYIPAYWTGSQATTSWNTINAGPLSNFSTDALGVTNSTAVPGALDTVIFSATTVAGPTLTTTLDAAFTIDSLQFIDNTNATPITAVNVLAGGGGTLNLTPISTSGGILVGANAGTATINVPLTIGAAQTWSVDGTGANGSRLDIAGNTAINAAVNKTGGGIANLNGMNTGAGGITLTGGTLGINSTTALGTGSLTINAGTTIDSSVGPVALSTINAQTWNGSFTFAGSQNLDLGTGAVTLGNNLTLTANANTLTVGGIIGGAFGLSKAGAGTLLLTNSNNYSGTTAITGGILRITNASALGTLGSGTTQSGSSALELDGTGGPLIIGAEALTINGGGIANAGALRNIAGNNTYGGTVTMAAQSRINSDLGTLTLNNATSVSAANLTLVVGGAGNTTISGEVAVGTGGVLKDGAGTLTLGGTNVYTGNTTVNAGVLNVTGSLTGNILSSQLLYGTTAGNSVVNVSGNMTLLQFAGANIAGSNTAYNQTAGIVNINPVTTDLGFVARVGYGAFTLSGGQINDTRRFDLNANSATAVGTGYITNATLNNNNGEWMILAYGGIGQMTVAGGGSITRVGATNPLGIMLNTTGADGTLNIAGGTVDAGTQPIRFGNGNISNTTGYVNLAGGTLSMGTNSTLSIGTGTGNFAYFNFAGGTLRATAALTSALVPGTGTTTINNTIFGAINNSAVAGAPSFAGGLTVDTNTFATTIATVLNGAAGSGVTQADLTVSGGSGYIGAPTVQFSTAGVIAGGTPASGYALMSGGSVTGIVITNPGTYTAGTTPTITLTGGGATIVPATVTAGPLNTANTVGGLTKINAGTLTLSVANTFTGPVAINGGTLSATLAGSLGVGGTISFGGGTLQHGGTNVQDYSSRFSTANGQAFSIDTVANNVTYGTGLSSATGGSLTKIGSGVLTLTGTQVYDGITTISGGTLQLGATVDAGSATGLLPAGTSIVNNGTLRINKSTNDTLSGVISGSGALVKLGSGNLTLSGINTFTGNVTMNAGTPVQTGTLTITNSSALGIGPKTITVISNVVPNANALILDGSGGDITLASDLSFTTSSNNGTGGIVSIAGNNAINGNFTLTGGGGSTRWTVNAGTLTLGGATITPNTASRIAIFDGTAVGTVNAILQNGGANVLAAQKSGTGTWTLNGAHTYTGTTTVDGGTLVVTGSIINNGSAQVLMAAPDDTLAGNPVLTRAVAAGLNTFGGFGSRVTIASVEPVTATALETTANILLSNTNAAPDNLSMQWRFRTAAEAAPANPNAVLSDVISVTGMDNGADLFVLQMSYNDAALTALGLNENSIALSGELRLGWNDAGTWKTATAGNTILGSTFVGVTDWNTYYTGISAVDDGSDLNLFLGRYGVNPANNTVWAVLDHNSEFAVIPEPSTLVLGGLALLGFAGAGLRRRRLAKQSA